MQRNKAYFQLLESAAFVGQGLIHLLKLCSNDEALCTIKYKKFVHYHFCTGLCSDLINYARMTRLVVHFKV